MIRPTGGRALLLLQREGWIKLKPDVPSTKVTPQDVVENTKNLKIIELEAAQLPGLSTIQMLL